MRAASVASWTRAVSVISRTSAEGSSPAVRKASCTWWNSSADASWRAERFTAIVSWPGRSLEPRRRGAAGGLEHPTPDRDDHPVLLGDGDELVGHDRAELGVLPAKQCLEPDDAVRRQLDDRLVDELELILLEGVGQLVLELEALERRRSRIVGS